MHEKMDISGAPTPITSAERAALQHSEAMVTVLNRMCDILDRPRDMPANQFNPDYTGTLNNISSAIERVGTQLSTMEWDAQEYRKVVEARVEEARHDKAVRRREKEDELKLKINGIAQ